MSATAVRVGSAREQQSSAAPYRLLVFIGVVAMVLSVMAFVLWGINGPATLFDMMIALCS